MNEVKVSKAFRLMLVVCFVLVAGCGRTIKATVRGAYDVSRAVALDSGEALYRTGQQMGSGSPVGPSGGFNSGGGMIDRVEGDNGPGVMSGAEDWSGGDTDGRVAVSMDEVREIARRYGYEIE